MQRTLEQAKKEYTDLKSSFKWWASERVHLPIIVVVLTILMLSLFFNRHEVTDVWPYYVAALIFVFLDMLVFNTILLFRRNDRISEAQKNIVIAAVHEETGSDPEMVTAYRFLVQFTVGATNFVYDPYKDLYWVDKRSSLNEKHSTFGEALKYASDLNALVFI